MKIRLSYNDKSILNNSFVRTINWIIIVILLYFMYAMCMNDLSASTKEIHTRLPIASNMLIAIFSPIITAILLKKVLKETTFYEWDYTDRNKKKRFTYIYIIICGILSSFLIISIVIPVCCLIEIFESNLYFMGYSMLVIPFYFIFNIVNIPSLYYTFFEECLTTAYKIQKKPDNWIDSGKEINNEDNVDIISKNLFD